MSKPGFLHVVRSVLAAFVGVQSDRNRHIDFKEGSWPVYIAVGLLATVLLILAIVALVTLVLG